MLFVSGKEGITFYHTRFEKGFSRFTRSKLVRKTDRKRPFQRPLVTTNFSHAIWLKKRIITFQVVYMDDILNLTFSNSLQGHVDVEVDSIQKIFKKRMEGQPKGQ